MSKTLGPIHYWMYNKLVFQNKLINELAALSQDKLEVPALPQGDLEDIIDASDIHGWLENLVSASEAGLAGVVSGLLAAGLTREEIYAAARSFGASNPLEGADVSEIWTNIDARTLNGMPCDKVVTAMKVDDGVDVVFAKDIHSQYWEALGIEGEVFINLREALIEGMLESSAFVAAPTDRGLTIKKVA